jgi:hypothetical protein
MNRLNWKRMAAIAAIGLGILAVIGMGVGRLFLDQWHWFEAVPSDPTDALVEQITAKGLTPEVAAAIRDSSLPEKVAYLYVAEVSGNQRILAAHPPALESNTVVELRQNLIPQHLQGRWTLAAAPDGHEYEVGTAVEQPKLPYMVGVPAFVTGLVAGALAWLALAVWIYLDARGSGSAAALGWGLLGLLAAPLALAVWIISRRVQGAAPVICPGCGADTPPDAVFCVRCGQAIRPTCPDCRRPVETDWGYCGACGTNLTE